MRGKDVWRYYWETATKNPSTHRWLRRENGKGVDEYVLYTESNMREDIRQFIADALNEHSLHMAEAGEPITKEVLTGETQFVRMMMLTVSPELTPTRYLGFFPN